MPSRYTERPACGASAATGAISCTWVALAGDGPRRDGGRVLPDACVDVIWDGSRLFVAGPDTGPVDVIERDAGSFHAGVRFRPGAAAAFLGMPVCAVRDERADASTIWGERVVARWRDALAELTPDEAAVALGTLVVGVARPDDLDGLPEPAVVDRIARGTSVRDVADVLGTTERTLQRTCDRHFGYGAKTLQQITRFRRFLALAEREPGASIGYLAALAGFHDQSHCHRDALRFSGWTPSELLVRRGVRSVQDATITTAQTGHDTRRTA